MVVSAVKSTRDFPLMEGSSSSLPASSSTTLLVSSAREQRLLGACGEKHVSGTVELPPPDGSGGTGSILLIVAPRRGVRLLDPVHSLPKISSSKS